VEDSVEGLFGVKNEENSFMDWLRDRRSVVKERGVKIEKILRFNLYFLQNILYFKYKNKIIERK